MRIVTEFQGIDGARHRIGVVKVDGTGQRGGLRGPCLVDEWQGHGARLLCAITTDDTDEQLDALVREYQREASTTHRPLSRRVEPSEIAQTAVALV